MTDLMTSPTEEGTTEMDLSNLHAREGELAEVPRGREPKPNPMAGLYERSLKTGKTLEVDVPAPDEAKRVVRLLRGYAMDMEKGVSVQIQRKKPENSKVETEVLPYERVAQLTKPGEIVTVAFQAKHERQRHS
jgi:hypothetical protein